MPRRQPDDTEKQLWQFAMRDAVPLRGGPADLVTEVQRLVGTPAAPAPTAARAAPPRAAEPRQRRSEAPPAARPALPPLAAPTVVPADFAIGARAGGKTPAAPMPVDDPRFTGIDRRSLQRLQRGKLEIAATLDLHGHGREQARDALDGFIRRGHAQGWRCVRVVTGKGMLSPDGGVLRKLVPQWLRDASLRPLILAFSPARGFDGGGGALYVLLRRQRDERED